MDAAKTLNLRNTALFLTIALLLAAPFAAQAQTAFVFPNGASASFSGTTFPGSTLVNADSGVITYTASQAFVSGDPVLSFSTPSGSFTTGQVLYFTIANTGGVTPGAHNITVNLTSTSPNSSIHGSITVTWVPNGSVGGTGQGATVSPTSLTLTSNFGTNGSNTFTLNNTSSGQVNYTVGVSYTTGNGWLSVACSNPAGDCPSGVGFLTVGAFQQFQATASPSGLANGTYQANITITLSNSGNGVISIPVTFTIGTNSGNGNLTASPNPVSLNYISGSNNAPSQFVTLTSSTGATAYGATITSGQSWMLVDGETSVGQNAASISSGLTVTTILGNLPTTSQTGTIVVTDSSGNVLTISVNFTINGQGTNNGLTLSPSPLQLSAAVGQTTLAQGTVTVGSNTSGTLGISYSGTGISAVLSNSSINAGNSQFVTVYGNPTGLSSGTYQGSLTVTLNGSTSTSINVNFVVGSGGTNGNGGSVAPTSLQFNYEVGNSSSLISQNVTNSVSGAFTTSITSGAAWLSVGPVSGTGPGLITVNVSPSSLSAGSTYSGSFTVTTPAGTSTETVSLFVSSSTVVFANPGTLNISYTGGSTNPSTSIQVIASDGSNVAVSGTSNQSWLTVTPLGTSTPTAMLINVNGAALSNGLNVGNVTISASASNSSLSVPVVVNVTNGTGTGSGSSLLTLGSSSLTFNGQLNGSVPSSQSLTVTASTATPYTATATTQNGNSTWLSISPSGGLNTASTSTLTVSVNQSGLAAGTYNGTINLSTNAGTQSVAVTLVVGSSGSGTGTGGSGAVTVSPNALTLTYSQGSVTGNNGFNVTTTSGNGTSVSYSVAVTTASGGSWLQTNTTSGFTPGAVSVSVNSSVVSALSPATYTGTVTVTPNGGSPVTVSVTLVVQGLPTVSASPATLNLSYQSGSTTTPSATIQVSGSAANLNFTANASSAGWLQVSPTSGTTGNNGNTLTVSINPAGLAAGTYQGTVVVSGTTGAAGSSTVTVNLTVTAPLPTISAVVNAASGASGAVSPGEIVSIFGPASNPIGPSTPASFTLTNGVVPTTLGGVQVLFNGIPAPLLAVSSTQINTMVPYGVAGVFAPNVQVRYLGQSSNSFSLNSAATAPGIFTQNQSGSGPGAILNSDNSVNGPGRPAAKGSVIVIYGTGEGATSPASVSGNVTCSNCTVAQLPVPLLPVTVTFVDSNNNRYPANFIYAGEAPGLVAGVLQVDAVVPTTVPSGTLQVIVGVGTAASQAGVTVTVQ